jgi:hypothetical protein
MNFLQIFKITSCRLLFNSEAILHVYMPPTESIVTTSSMLICHYWSPYLSKRETVLEAQLTGLGLWKIKYRNSGRSSTGGFQLSESWPWPEQALLPYCQNPWPRILSPRNWGFSDRLVATYCTCSQAASQELKTIHKRSSLLELWHLMRNLDQNHNVFLQLPSNSGSAGQQKKNIAVSAQFWNETKDFSNFYFEQKNGNTTVPVM